MTSISTNLSPVQVFGHSLVFFLLPDTGHCRKAAFGHTARLADGVRTHQALRCQVDASISHPPAGIGHVSLGVEGTDGWINFRRTWASEEQMPGSTSGRTGRRRNRWLVNFRKTPVITMSKNGDMRFVAVVVLEQCYGRRCPCEIHDDDGIACSLSARCLKKIAVDHSG